MIYWTWCPHCKQKTGSQNEEMVKMTKEIWWLEDNQRDWKRAAEEAWDEIEMLKKELYEQ